MQIVQRRPPPHIGHHMCRCLCRHHRCHGCRNATAIAAAAVTAATATAAATVAATTAVSAAIAAAFWLIAVC